MSNAMVQAPAAIPPLLLDPRPALGLRRPAHTRSIPVHMLYEDGGSALYEEIERHPDYYPYEAERRLLERHAGEIVARLPRGAVLVELGCGDCTKTRILLSALSERDGRVDYVGIDASAECLASSAALFDGDRRVHFTPIHDNFFDGLALAARLYPERELVVMLLGSTLGNMSFDDSCLFVRTVLELSASRRAGPRLLFGLDMWKDEQTLRRAYHNDITAQFELNGLRNALRRLEPGCAFAHEDWRYVVEISHSRSQVEMYAEAVRRCRVAGVDFDEAERVLLEVSHKFRDDEVPRLFEGCEVSGRYGDGYRLYMLEGKQVDHDNPWRTYAERDIDDIDRVARLDYVAFVHAYDWPSADDAPLSLLDVGCGSGTLPSVLASCSEASHAFARSVGSYDLLDISANSLRIAAQRLPFHVERKYHTAIQDFSSSEHFAEACARGYDMVWSIHGITAVAPEHLDASLLSMLRCTRIGGRTVVVMSDHDSHYASIDRAWRDDRLARGVETRSRFLEAEDVIAAFDRHGIDSAVVSMEASYLFPHEDGGSFRRFNAWCVYDIEFDVLASGPAVTAYLASCHDPEQRGHRLRLSSKAVTVRRDELMVLRWLARDCSIASLDDARYAACAAAFEARSTQRAEITRHLVESGIYPSLAARANNDLRVLSVGCGDGAQDLAMLRAALAGAEGTVIRYTGIDTSEAQRARCLQTMADAGHLHPTIMAPEALPDDTRFDVIHLLHVLYYVQDVQATIRWALERLAPGGRLLIWHAPFEQMNQLARVFWARDQHIPFADDVERALRSEGCTHVRTRIEGTWRLRDDAASSDDDAAVSFLVQADTSRLDATVRAELEKTLDAIAGPGGTIPHPVCCFVVERGG